MVFLELLIRGRAVLEEKYEALTANYLKKFDEFKEFQNIDNKNNDDENTISDESSATPIELFESSYKKLRNDIKNELLEQIFSCSPFFFEKLVVDLLINLGYGGFKKRSR